MRDLSQLLIYATGLTLKRHSKGKDPPPVIMYHFTKKHEEKESPFFLIGELPNPHLIRSSRPRASDSFRSLPNPLSHVHSQPRDSLPRAHTVTLLLRVAKPRK